MENDINKLMYLMLVVGKKKRHSSLSYESLVFHDQSDNLTMMTSTLPIQEDTYLCETTLAQQEAEQDTRDVYEQLIEQLHGSVTDAPLNVDRHLSYIEKYLNKPLPGPFYVLDSNHSWMIYWLLNAHSVLSGEDVSAEMRTRASASLRPLIIDNGKGGIAGGPNGQIGHVALTYAAVLALALIEDYDTLSEIRENLYGWLLSLKHHDGSFAMHLGGERDTRSTYCVLLVASLLDITTPQLVENSQRWILSCQTFEGGFAGVPNAEAHGGYTFCALASLFLLGDIGTLDVDLLASWLAARQLQVEGGFSGRTNKLVDACYSFWVGASLCLVECLCDQIDLFNRDSLRSYILNCCQEESGGLRDKIGKSPDFYHTNYTLCGLSLAEHKTTSDKVDAYSFQTLDRTEGCAYTVGINPVFGLPVGTAEKCKSHFRGQSE